MHAEQRKPKHTFCFKVKKKGLHCDLIPLDVAESFSLHPIYLGVLFIKLKLSSQPLPC